MTNQFEKMELSHSFALRDHRQAANLLADRLMGYKNTNALVLAIPAGGAIVGYHVAKTLNLSLDVIPGSSVKHPSNPKEIIASICMDNVSMKEECHDIPQDYVSHQVLLNQYELKAKYKFYREDKTPEDIKGRIVILITDRIIEADSIMASLKSIIKQEPDKIIVAVPVISLQAQHQIMHEVNEVIFLNDNGENMLESFDEVNDDDVRNLVLNYQKNSESTS